ncbi:MAG: hypothetical protein AAB368_15475, partial [bacterium]
GAGGSFAQDGSGVMVVGPGGIRIGDGRTGTARAVVLAEHGLVSCGAFSPNGRWIVLGDDDGARIHEAKTGKALGAPMGHSGQVLSAVFSPDSTLVVTGSFDQTARIWHVPSGLPAGPALRHRFGVPVVAFSPDGRTAICGTYTGEVHLWDVATCAPLGMPLQAGGPPVALVLSLDNRGLMVLAQVYPQFQRWRTDWLADEPGPAELTRRVTLASQRFVSPGGALSPISAAELMALRTARSSKTP